MLQKISRAAVGAQLTTWTHSCQVSNQDTRAEAKNERCDRVVGSVGRHVSSGPLKAGTVAENGEPIAVHHLKTSMTR